jgi:hypothetical protein
MSDIPKKGGIQMKRLFGIGLFVTLVLILMGCGKSETVEGTTYLGIDINPSIEFVLDENGVVVSFLLVNEDGETVAADIDFIGMTYEEALEAFLNAAMETGFLDVTRTDNTVVVTVGADDDETEDTIAVGAQEEAWAFLEQHRIGGAILDGELVLEDLKLLADEYNISIGKVRVIESILAVDDSRTFEELVDIAMKDLIKELVEDHKEEMRAFADSKKAAALERKETATNQAQAALEQHQTKVQNGEINVPDFNQILDDELEDRGMDPTQYRQDEDEARSNAENKNSND